MIALLTGSCKEEEWLSNNAKHFFYVRNSEVDLPVVVEGNTTSKTFIIYVHGGPEGGAITESTDPVFWGALEAQYAVVYYDQRGIGMSNGNFDDSKLTIEQFVDDLDKIISVVYSRYGDDISLFLLGGSWGGYVGTAYITNPTYQSKLKGWIEIGGGHNLALIGNALPAHIKKIAEQQISKGISVEEWQKHIDFVNEYDTTANDFKNWLSLIQKYSPITDQLTSDGEIHFLDTKVKIPKSVNLLTILANDYINQPGAKLLGKYYNTSLTGKLSTVTLPSRFFWGEYDCVSPPVLAYDAYDNIGTSPQHKKVVVFKNADHTIFLTKPTELLNEIFSFINLYK